MSADTPRRLGRGLEALISTAKQQRDAPVQSDAPAQSDLRQVQIAAGLLVLAGVALGFLVHPTGIALALLTAAAVVAARADAGGTARAALARLPHRARLR